MTPTLWALIIGLAALLPLADIVRTFQRDNRRAATVSDVDRIEAGYGSAVEPAPCVADGWRPRHRAPRGWRPTPIRVTAVGRARVVPRSSRARFDGANPYAVHRDGWRPRPGVAALIAMWAPVDEPVAPVVTIGRPPLVLARAA